MAIIFESIYLAKNIISLQIKAHEVYIKPLKPRESILEIKESDDEDDYEVKMKLNHLMKMKTMYLKIKSN